jgi:hypothetical protein
MSTDVIATSPAPDNDPVPNPQQQFKALTEPLWEEFKRLLAEAALNRYERGKVLNQLNELYAEHHVGTFCSHLAGLGIATTTAYQWIAAYRKAENLPPLGARKFEADEALSKEETRKADGNAGSGGGVKRDTRYVLSDRITFSSGRKPIWVANVKKVISGLAANGYTNESGTPLDNKHDAVFEAVAIVAAHLAAETAQTTQPEVQHEA